MAASSAAVRWTIVVAFGMAALLVIYAMLSSVILLAAAIIPLCAGIGIVRKRVWSARGFAIYASAQVLLALVVLPRSPSPSKAVLLGSVLMSALVALLFFTAAQDLARSGAVRGWAFPWIAVALLTTVPLIFLQPFIIPTGSMENTLLIGGRVLVQRIPHPAANRDAIVVMNYAMNRREQFIKRIAGIPGDRIRISHKILHRNGLPLSEPWVVRKTEYEDAWRDDFPSQPTARLFPTAQEMLAHIAHGEVIVPSGKYFVLGDNRDQSLDSRYLGFGDAADIIGKPVMIYDSHNEPVGPNPQARVLIHHNTRWNRIFKLL
jgi:signal peptidase I